MSSSSSSSPVLVVSLAWACDKASTCAWYGGHCTVASRIKFRGFCAGVVRKLEEDIFITSGDDPKMVVHIWWVTLQGYGRTCSCSFPCCFEVVLRGRSRGMFRTRPRDRLPLLVVLSHTTEPRKTLKRFRFVCRSLCASHGCTWRAELQNFFSTMLTALFSGTC